MNLNGFCKVTTEPQAERTGMFQFARGIIIIIWNRVWNETIFELHMQFISIYNMGTSGLPDMYTLGPRVHPGPEGRGRTYQADRECPSYKYYVTL